MLSTYRDLSTSVQQTALVGIQHAVAEVLNGSASYIASRNTKLPFDSIIECQKVMLKAQSDQIADLRQQNADQKAQIENLIAQAQSRELHHQQMEQMRLKEDKQMEQLRLKEDTTRIAITLQQHGHLK